MTEILLFQVEFLKVPGAPSWHSIDEAEVLWTMVLCQADTNGDGKMTPEEFLAWKTKDRSSGDHSDFLACLPAGCDRDEFLARIEKVADFLK